MENNFKDLAIKILAVVGVLGILSIGGFFTIVVFSKLPDLASNLGAQVVSITQRFIPSAGDILISLDDSVAQNGEQINLTFSHQSKDEGSYSFFYECRNGIHFERNNEIIFCNTPYSFINQDNLFSFKVFTTNDQKVSVPISINFIKNNATRISGRGDTTLDVDGSFNTSGIRGTTNNVDNVVIVPSNGNLSGNSRVVNRVEGIRTEETILFNETSGRRPIGLSDPAGFIDLKPTIIAVGKVDRSTNEFTATSSVHVSDRGAVKFEVENIGTRVSPAWTFSVVLPSFPRYIYYSKSQQALLPGDKIEYIVGFDSIKRDSNPNTIIVNIDPINSLREGGNRKDNNIVKIDLPAFGD